MRINLIIVSMTRNSPIQQLIEIAEEVEPSSGYLGYFDLVDALEANTSAMARFRAVLEQSKAEELDRAEGADDKYGLVIRAADALDLLPDDPRLFKSPEELDAMHGDEALKGLCSACIVNDVRAVQALARRVDVNQTDHNGQTALGYANGNNHIECVKALLSEGADPNTVERRGNTTLHYCASGSKEIFALLLEAGGSLDVKNDEGKTPIDVLNEFNRIDWLPS